MCFESALVNANYKFYSKLCSIPNLKPQLLNPLAVVSLRPPPKKLYFCSPRGPFSLWKAQALELCLLGNVSVQLLQERKSLEYSPSCGVIACSVYLPFKAPAGEIESLYSPSVTSKELWLEFLGGICQTRHRCSP